MPLHARTVSQWRFPGSGRVQVVGWQITRTFAIVATYANETVDNLHDRMPAILELRDWPTWLGEVEGDAVTLLKSAGDDVLKVWPQNKWEAWSDRLKLTDCFVYP